jgi:hypothetical protein
MSINRITFPIVAVCCFINPFALHGEDLTTLDGKTFSNISNVSVYPKQVFFNCNGERASVLSTNLPEAFRIQHGVVINTNAPVVATERQPQILSSTVVSGHSFGRIPSHGQLEE